MYVALPRQSNSNFPTGLMCVISICTTCDCGLVVPLMMWILCHFRFVVCHWWREYLYDFRLDVRHWLRGICVTADLTRVIVDVNSVGLKAWRAWLMTWVVCVWLQTWRVWLMTWILCDCRCYVLKWWRNSRREFCVTAEECVTDDVILCDCRLDMRHCVTDDANSVWLQAWRAWLMAWILCNCRFDVRRLWQLQGALLFCWWENVDFLWCLFAFCTGTRALSFQGVSEWVR